MIPGAPRRALPGQPLPGSSAAEGQWRAETVLPPFNDPSSPVQVEGQGPGLAYEFQGTRETIDLNEIMAYFLAGHIEAVRIYDPGVKQNTDLFDTPPALQSFILSRRLLPPGAYQYRLNWQASAADYTDAVYDGSLTPFTAGNVKVGPYASGKCSVKSLTSITFHFVNTTNQDATYQIYGGPSRAGPWGVLPGLGTGTVAAAVIDLPVGMNLQSAVIPYIYATLTFTTAPTSGYAQIFPIGRKVA